MTDLPLSPNTHSVPSLDSTAPTATVTQPLPSALPNGFAEDEEDYTIKCICGFQEDDGSTILCETCQTWQHIECYYASQGIRTPGDDENHYCHECEPRFLNSKSAAERQREKREGIDLIDPKAKKPATSKGHRKKKASDHVTNGWPSEKHDGTLRNGTNGSPREHAPSSKRSKGSHRASTSVQTIPLKMTAQSSRRSTSASHTLQSPSKSSHKSSQVEGEPYSVDFMQLYDGDPGETSMQGNLMNDIVTANHLSQWSHDADAVKEATDGKSHQDVFLRSEHSVDDMETPIIKRHIRIDESREFHGRHPKWTYLTVESETPMDMVVGEIRGKIGQLRDYTQDEANRWDYLRHPLPFVFFHPYLPIYIDARQEGTIFRYVRRSCKPSLTLKTFLENGSEMRFCFCASRALAPGEELTLAWTPDEYVRKFVRYTREPEKYDVPMDVDENYVREFYSKVLPDFGGCACEDPEKCSCSVRNIHPVDHKMTNGKPKKGRKGITSQSRSNGRTPSSRSGSEALRYQDEDDQDDDRSTSASSRSKPHSRDATPPDQRSDREKRKMDAIIEAINNQEQEERKTKRPKNKRPSGGNINNVPASASRLTFGDRSDLKTMANDGFSASAPNTPAVLGKTRYMDVGTLRKGSNSPQTQSPIIPSSMSKGIPSLHSPTGFSPLSRPNYVDTATQVNMDKDTSMPPSPSFQRRPVVSLTKRLLKRCHRERVELDKKREESVRTPTPSQSPALSERPVFGSPASTTAILDVKDGDGDVIMGNEVTQPPISASAASEAKFEPKVSAGETKIDDGVSMGTSPKPKLESPEMPAPAMASPAEDRIKDQIINVNGFRSAGLHVQLPSPPPLSSIPNSNTTTSTVTHSPILQTPTSVSQAPLFAPTTTSSLTQPSPVKKKLSLGDYMSRRSSNIQKAESASHTGGASAASEKDQSPTAMASTEALTKPLETLLEEAKEKAASVANALVDTPKVDDVGDPMAVDVPAADKG